MPTLIIDDMPQSLFERIEQLAQVLRQKPSDAVVDVLEAAFSRGILALSERLPSEPFLSEEICAPCSIPRPVGERVVPIEVVNYTPNPHDIPGDE